MDTAAGAGSEQPAYTGRSPKAFLRDRTFRSLRHRNYRLYFFGQIVSFTGSWMQSAALMWLAFDLTADPFWPPLLLATQVGPTLFLGPLGGAAADRFPKRHLIIATQSAFLATAIALTLLTAVGFATPFLLLGFAAVNGVVLAFDLPARLSFVPDLIPRTDLINAVGLNALLFNSARAVGPALAGLMFVLADAAAPLVPGVRSVVLGAAACFLFNAVSYAAVLAALRKIDVGTIAAGSMQTARQSPLDGVRYLVAHPPLGGLVVLTGLFSIFAWPAITLLPAYTKLVLGREEQAYSLLVSCLGAGALTAAAATATFGTPARRGRFLLAGAMCGVAGLAGLAAANAFAAAAGCCGILGFGLILYLSTGQSTLQLAVPDATRGRVMALWAMTLSASAPVGHLLAGRAAQTYPVPWVLAAMAGGVGLTAVGLAALVRRMSRA